LRPKSVATISNAKKRKTTMPERSPKRLALDNAIAARSLALGNAARAEERLQNANRVLSELLAKRHEYDSLDDEISKAKSAMVVASIERGERPPTQAPPGFASRLTGRESIDAELNSVRSTIPVLEGELKAAKDFVEDCRYRIEECVEAVVRAETEELSAEYMQKLLEVREMAYRLHYLSTRQVQRDTRNMPPSPTPGVYNINSAPLRPIRIGAKTAEALQDNPLGNHEFHHGIRLREGTGKAVASYWAQLHDNAAAQYEIAVVPAPLDKVAFAAELRVALADTREKTPADDDGDVPADDELKASGA
jgi:hypothetical protein